MSPLLKRYFRLLLLVIFFLSLAIAINAQAIEVTDYNGRKVMLDAPAKRIVALSPHIVENVYSAGAGGLLVGVVSYSDYPLEAKKIPQVGSYMKASFETILALKPDLVLLWGTGGGGYSIIQLENLGLTVYVDDPKKLEDVARSMRDIGVLAGTENASNKAANAYLQQLKQLREKYTGQQTVSVFYEIWNEPLQTLNGKHLVSDIMQLCGGRNIYAKAIPLAPKINIESIFERDPQMIVASGTGNKRPAWLNDWKRWPQLTAVKFDNLFFIPPDILQRHTARILQGAALFCEHIETARKRLAASEKL